jgi:FixJ family two-component response regulator
MEARKEIVCVVVDESPAGQDLSTLLQAKGKDVRLFASMRDLFDFRREDSCACLIVSLKMLGTGQEAQELISVTSIPVIFITGREDISSAVSAMKAGPIDVLTKPIGEAFKFIAGTLCERWKQTLLPL